MRVAIVGATGNAGTSLLRALADEPAVDSVVGIARRRPEADFAKTEWAEADVVHDDLVALFRGADAVVHLAWLVQPSHDLDAVWLTNVEGSARIFRAVAEAGVKALVYASSIGAYSRGPKDRRVDESWPTQGIPTSHYARHKAEVERRLDAFERERADVRVVRLRPGLVFSRDVGVEIRRLWAGPFLPTPLLRPGLVPFVPDTPGLVFQAVHSLDIGEAYRLALVRDVRGAFNVAAEPVLDPRALARLLRARRVPVPARVLRTLADVSWRAHLQPTPAGWIDLAVGVPVMDTTRAREELGWEPRFTSEQAFLELLEGMRESRGLPTPPLDPETSGPARSGEIASGIGERNP